MRLEELENLFRQLLVDVARELGFQFGKTRAAYILSNDKISIGFTSFVERNGKFKIVMSSRSSKHPIWAGEYTPEELQGDRGKAKLEIMQQIQVLNNEGKTF